MKYLERNPMTAVFFFGTCVCLAVSSGNIKANLSAVSQLQQTVRENSAQEWRLRASQQSAQTQAAIAKQRYEEGCVMVVAMKDPNSFTSLSVGQPVIDRVRKTELPVGTIVCDANGNTARIVPGNDKSVVGEIAFTGDRKVVEEAKKRTNKRYVLPNL
jgi:hypothetical protein